MMIACIRWIPEEFGWRVLLQTTAVSICCNWTFWLNLKCNWVRIVEGKQSDIGQSNSRY